jgi:hypothetical protein
MAVKSRRSAAPILLYARAACWFNRRPTVSAGEFAIARRGASNVVLLTQLGGGAFGNHDDWVHAAMRRALEMMSGYGLDVRLVSYGTPSRAIVQMAEDFA